MMKSVSKTARLQMDSLLGETLAAARVRQQNAFDKIADGRRKVVIFGAGRLGRAVCQGLVATDLEPVAFSDNNPRTWGTVVEDLPVLAPEDAALKHSQDAVFIVAIWHPSSSPLMAALLEQVRTMACSAVPFPMLFWRLSKAFLPYFFWDLPFSLLQQSSEIAAAFEMLEDEDSRQTFANQLQLRLLADFECIGSPFPGEQYFPGLFSLTASECFVDCGAYTGDTIRSFMGQTRNSFRKVIAFEADSAVMPSLQTFVNSMGSKAVLHKSAVGAHTGTVRFSGNGIGGGHIADSGVEVRCVRLDDTLGSEYVSLIKMDIEGAEMQALEGARGIIGRDRPVLAVCCYHKPDHLWRVPAALKNRAPDSALFMRSHCTDGLDTVCYAVPPERQLVSRHSHNLKSLHKSRAQTRGSVS